MTTITLEVLRAALDCVAEKAELNRQEMYLWVRAVIPDEVWKPVWENYTADLIREQDSLQGTIDPRKSAKSMKPQKSTKAIPSRGCDDRGYESHAPRSPERADCSYEGYGHSSLEYMHQEDELANLPELRSKIEDRQHQRVDPGLERQGSPLLDRQDSPPCDDDRRSVAETLRSEADKLANDAMSNWLDDGQVSRASLSPLELGHWLRTLPRDRLDGETLKVVARHVLNNSMDEEEVAAAVAATGFASLGVTDQRQAQILERYFKQRQSEAAMAEAAKTSGALNRQFNAKLEAKAKAWKS
jgi:hypothetical protein